MGTHGREVQLDDENELTMGDGIFCCRLYRWKQDLMLQWVVLSIN